MNNKKIAIILGTRPEIIKLSSIIRYCLNNSLNFFIIHTNQHYSQNMDSIFFRELGLPKPKYNLKIGSGSHGDMTGRMIIQIEKILLKEKPHVVLIQGDTNSVLAGAVVGSKLNLKVGHIEAGLRSYDRSMPEETNRVITDHVSDLLFCPTKKQSEILSKEGINKKNIFITGNTIVDAVTQCSKIADKKSTILKDVGIGKDEYVLLTVHRPATVDNKINLYKVIDAVRLISEDNNLKVIFSIHPRTKKMIEKFKIKIPKNFIILEPLGYIDMLKLQKNSILIITDSGGIQEESCILKKKCLILRDNTERPEALSFGGCMLAGNSDTEKIIKTSKILLSKKNKWKNPFGDGRSGERIIKIINAQK